jgi:citrate transporter, CitMHS family
MITIFAWAMIIVFLALVMMKKMQPFTALVIVPIAFGLIGAFMGIFSEATMELLSVDSVGIMDQVQAIGTWTVMGLRQTATTAFMLLFAILFFAILLNAGLFDPITKAMVKFSGGDPVKVLLATAVVSAAVSLNGDGTTTTLICCTAFVPLYKKLDMKLLYLATVVVLMNTIMNLLPWGGPTARVLSVLDGLTAQDMMNALIPGMIVSTIYMLGVSYYLGIKERKRVGVKKLSDAELSELFASVDPEVEALKRPKLILFNAVLMIGTIGCLIFASDFFPAAYLFMLATCIALLINYPNLKEQKARIEDNAADALSVVILVIGAGVFMGIFTNSGMSTALANSMLNVVPESLGRYWGLITAIVSAPGTYFLSNDAFYYGVLPVFAEAGAKYGFTALELGTASLLGQAYHLLSPLVAFIYLLLKLTEQDMGEWQKESGKWATGIFIIFIIVSAITGVVPLVK